VFKLPKKKPRVDKTAEATPRYTFTESMATFAFRHFGKISQKMLTFMPDAQSLFLKSGLNYTPEVFYSLVILSSILTLPISAVTILLIVLNHRFLVLFPLILLPLTFSASAYSTPDRLHRVGRVRLTTSYPSWWATWLCSQAGVSHP